MADSSNTELAEGTADMIKGHVAIKTRRSPIRRTKIIQSGGDASKNPKCDRVQRAYLRRCRQGS